MKAMPEDTDMSSFKRLAGRRASASDNRAYKLMAVASLPGILAQGTGENKTSKENENVI